jgi:DNA-binding transcriptional regulator YdaS (Cro superfamily)
MNKIQSVRKQFKTQNEMALFFGVTQAAVCQWLSGDKKVSPRIAILMEKNNGIPREEIRPDIFGK